MRSPWVERNRRNRHKWSTVSQAVSQSLTMSLTQSVCIAGNFGVLSFFTGPKCPFRARGTERERGRVRRNGCQKPKRHETLYATLGNCLENWQIMLVSGTISFSAQVAPSRLSPFRLWEWEVPEAQAPPAVATTETHPSVAHTISIYKFESLHSNSSSSSLRIINNSICARTRNSSQVALHPSNMLPLALLPSRSAPLYVATSPTEFITYSCKLSAKAHTKE